MKKKCISNGITVNDDGTATVKCGDKIVKVKYEDDTKKNSPLAQR